MTAQTAQELCSTKCAPCEGGVAPMSAEESAAQLKEVDGWQIVNDGRRIRRNWTVKNFMAGIQFFNAVADLAEAEGHHPDLHIEGYRNVWIEIWTHAIGGLSINDFILAAKIDELPIDAKQPRP